MSGIAVFVILAVVSFVGAVTFAMLLLMVAEEARNTRRRRRHRKITGAED